MGGNSQAFNAGFQGGQGMNAGSPGFNQGGQAFGQNGTGYGGQVSQLTQPSGSQGAGQGQTGTAPAHHSAPHTASPAGHAGSHAGSAQSAAKPLSGPELLASLGIIAQPTAKGVTVTTIGIGSRAAKAGIAPGDVVLAVDGVSVQSLTHFAALLSHKHQGESAKLLINRQGTIGQVVL